MLARPCVRLKLFQAGRAPPRPPAHRLVHGGRLLEQPRHPAFQDLSDSLVQLPEFPARADDVRIIYSPKDFYQTLLVSLSEAVPSNHMERFRLSLRP